MIKMDEVEQSLPYFLVNKINKTLVQCYWLSNEYNKILTYTLSRMQDPLISHQQQAPISKSFGKINPDNIVTFRQCFKLSYQTRQYQNKIFILMAAYWIFASFFISMEFYLFKKPIYCDHPFETDQSKCCFQGDEKCGQQICRLFPATIKEHTLDDGSLTYQFGLFCGSRYQWVRVILKILPEALSIVGMLIYGALADRKGRKTAIKISWRMYTFGVIIFSVTQTMPLRIFGYLIACIHCYPALISQFTLLFELNIQKSKNKSSLLLLACLFVGPLILSFISKLIFNNFKTRIILIVFCAAPAFILSFLVNKLIESPIFTYPFNKIHAFNLINQLSKINKQPPILIDLSRSHWHRHKIPEQSFINLLRKKKLFIKLIVGVFFMFTIYLTIKISQIYLDPLTDVFQRSIIINIPTAIADLTLCFFLNQLINKTCRFMFIGNCIILITMIILKNQIQYGHEGLVKTLQILMSILLRYFSELCYGIILIWAIETFPTINRSYCVGIVVGGSSLGVILAYSIKSYSIELLAVALGCSIIALGIQGFLEINGKRNMVDTYDGKYYDEHDSFYKF